ncbi:hypothetical protein [Sphingobium sp. KCTC 72723]|uniref:hypothetical protein n=1 Tax=Sphingobium sp. KCTC 72723 TaxID=2733867 RepID=UPI00165D75A6|nr:hypothetical protein [Sphingobium sp. KCTC 72723]
MTDQEHITALTDENILLRKTIEIQKRQMQEMYRGDEVNRLRAKLAEWEDSMPRINGGYYHGKRFIVPYRDHYSDDGSAS